jgi:DNA-binding CsgD family transcriptional regulator
LDDAADLAERVEWRAIRGEERVALLLLAELYAPHDGALAMSYVARYQETGDRYEPLLASNADRRVPAIVAYCLGYVHEQLGELEEAEESYKEAFEIYDAIGYDWRAGRAALGLSRIVKDSTSWKNAAKKKLQQYPLSWLAAQLNGGTPEFSMMPSAPKMSKVRERASEELTPAQHKVYELLLKGLSTRAIAEELDRSEFTVRNHIKVVFKKLKVNSRAALLSASLK